jgi:fibronectin-binding autotransporter adhesin
VGGNATLQADAGATLQTGQVTGLPEVALGTPGTAGSAGSLTFIAQSASTASALGNVSVGSATGGAATGSINVGPNNIVTFAGMNVVNGSTLIKLGTGTALFDATGLTAGTNINSLLATLDSTSAVNVNGGALRMNIALTGGGAFNVNSGGTLGGAGSITGPATVTAGGTIKPSAGASPAAPSTFTAASLTITSGSGVANAGNASFLVNGKSAGTYDQVAVSSGGVIALSGNLQITMGYTPALNDSFILINNLTTPGTSDLPTGTFSFENGSPITNNKFTMNGDTFTLSYAGGDGNDVVVTTTAVPEPASVGCLALGGLGLLARRRRRCFRQQ